MTDDMRLASAADMLTLAHESRAHNLNRQLDPNPLRRLLDPKGVNVLQVLLPFHSRGDAAADEMHHRVRVLLRYQGTDTPHLAELDVLAAQWQRLTRPEEITGDSQGIVKI